MAQNHFSIKSGSTTSAITPWKWNLENINVPTTKCTKLCIVDTWSVRVAHQKFIHHVSNHWQNSMIFPGWCFQIPWFFQVFGPFSNSLFFPGLEIFFFIFQVSMIFPEAGKPVLSTPLPPDYNILPTHPPYFSNGIRGFPRNRQLFCWKMWKNYLSPRIFLVTWLKLVHHHEPSCEILTLPCK